MNAILRRMKLWQKFAVLGIIGTVATAVPMSLTLRSEQEQLKVAADELSGLSRREALKHLT